MDETKQGDTTVSPPETNEAPASTPSQDPVADAVRTIEATPKRSRLETLKYNKERLERELAEEMAKNGVVDDDNRPLTVAEFKALRSQESQQTAISRANALTDENERKLTIHHLEHTIRPSGDPDADFALARSIVNSVKNGQLLEETARVQRPRSVASAPSAPPKSTQKSELTKEEQDYKMAFKLTDEQVIAARPQQ